MALGRRRAAEPEPARLVGAALARRGRVDLLEQRDLPSRSAPRCAPLLEEPPAGGVAAARAALALGVRGGTSPWPSRAMNSSGSPKRCSTRRAARRLPSRGASSRAARAAPARRAARRPLRAQPSQGRTPASTCARGTSASPSRRVPREQRAVRVPQRGCGRHAARTSSSSSRFVTQRARARRAPLRGEPLAEPRAARLGVRARHVAVPLARDEVAEQREALVPAPRARGLDARRTSRRSRARSACPRGARGARSTRASGRRRSAAASTPSSTPPPPPPPRASAAASRSATSARAAAPRALAGLELEPVLDEPSPLVAQRAAPRHRWSTTTSRADAALLWRRHITVALARGAREQRSFAPHVRAARRLRVGAVSASLSTISARARKRAMAGSLQFFRFRSQRPRFSSDALAALKRCGRTRKNQIAREGQQIESRAALNALSLVRSRRGQPRASPSRPGAIGVGATILALRRARRRTSPRRPYRRPTAATPGAGRGPAPAAAGARRAHAPARMPRVSEAELVRGALNRRGGGVPAAPRRGRAGVAARFGGGESVASSVADGLTLDELARDHVRPRRRRGVGATAATASRRGRSTRTTARRARRRRAARRARARARAGAAGRGAASRRASRRARRRGGAWIAHDLASVGAGAVVRVTSSTCGPSRAAAGARTARASTIGGCASTPAPGEPTIRTAEAGAWRARLRRQRLEPGLCVRRVEQVRADADQDRAFVIARELAVRRDDARRARESAPM